MLSAALTDLTASMAVNDARNRWMTVRRVTLGTRSAEASCWPEIGSVLHFRCMRVSMFGN